MSVDGCVGCLEEMERLESTSNGRAIENKGLRIEIHRLTAVVEALAGDEPQRLEVSP